MLSMPLWRKESILNAKGNQLSSALILKGERDGA
jgi:hypothetical protein